MEPLSLLFCISLWTLGYDVRSDLQRDVRRNPNASFFHPSPQLRASQKVNWSERMLEKFRLPNVFKDDVPGQPNDYFTCTFQANKLNK